MVSRIAITFCDYGAHGGDFDSFAAPVREFGDVIGAVPGYESFGDPFEGTHAI